MKDRFEIAADLRRIAEFLKLAGENPFKAQAYERGARALERFEGDLAAYIKEHRLRQIPGIGEALSKMIEEIYTTGECRLLDQLRDEMPAGAVELSALAGLSLKKIRALNAALQIDSIAALKTACEQGLVAGVKGFGAKSEAKLLSEIAKSEKREDGVFLLQHALEEGARLLDYLRAGADAANVDIAGAVRRRRETVRELSLVASSDRPRGLMDRFLAYPSLARTDSLTDSHCMGRLSSGLIVKLAIVSPLEHAIALHRETGSSRHIAKLESLARIADSAVDDHPQHAETLPGESEEGIYRNLGLQLVPPELREDQGEIEAARAGSLPRLVTEADIRGMIHCHTEYSDGRNSIEEMALAAQAKGMRYVTITDHSPSAFYARGVNIDRLRAQWEEIARVQERVGIRILKGTESDILADGSLDYPDYLLEQFDIIIASIHSRHKMDSQQMTARLRRALSLPVFKVWGHPLGRLLQSRPPFDCDMEEILDVIAEARCAIEVNGDPHRLDLEPVWIRAARARRIKFVVSTDAHSTTAMNYLSFGVAMARRGWLEPGEVLNTLDTAPFMRTVHP